MVSASQPAGRAPEPITAYGYVRLAVWDGASWIRPRANGRGDARRDVLPGVIEPAQPSLLELLERMAAANVAQLWITPRPICGGEPVSPSADELERLSAAGWRYTLAHSRPGRQGGEWISCYKPGRYGVREVYFPARDPESVWHDWPMEDGERMAAELAAYTLALASLWFRSGGSTGARLMSQAVDVHRYVIEPAAPPAPGLQPGGFADGALLWLRDLNEAERHARYLVQVDKRAAWLSAAGAVTLGVGKPLHLVGADAAMSGGRWAAGIYLLQDYTAPLAPLAYDLPDPLESAVIRWTAGRGRASAWVCAPTLALLTELGASYSIAEAYVWPAAHRVLEPWYQRLRAARSALVSGEYPRALAMLKQTYTHGLGRLATRRPGWDRANDWQYQPIWYQSLKAQSRATLYRAAYHAALAGWRAIAAHTDCLYYLLEAAPELTPGFAADHWNGALGVFRRDASGVHLGAYNVASWDLTNAPRMRAALLDTRLMPLARLTRMEERLAELTAATPAAAAALERDGDMFDGEGGN